MEAWKEYFVYGANFLPLTGGSGTVFTDNEIRIDPDSDFEFHSTIHTATSDNYRLEYRDDSLGRFLQKGTLDARTVVGKALSGINANGFLPYIWPMPYRIAAATTLNVRAADASGSDNTIRLALHGGKIRPGAPPWEKKYRKSIPYAYPLNASGTITVGASGTSSASIATDRDAAFEVRKIVGHRSGACLVTIKDAARDAQWMNGPIHFDALVGNSQFPNVLPARRFILPGGVITITVTDLSGSSNTIELNLVGRKLYE